MSCPRTQVGQLNTWCFLGDCGSNRAYQVPVSGNVVLGLPSSIPAGFKAAFEFFALIEKIMDLFRENII
jgi:hypothetical protein